MFICYFKSLFTGKAVYIAKLLFDPLVSEEE